MGFLEEHDLSFHDPRFVLSFVEIFKDWYHHHLRGAPMKISWGPVRIYDPGRGVWIDRETLWGEDREPLVLYLHGGPGAASCSPEGSLIPTTPPEDVQILYTYDPLDPVINYGGPLLNMLSGCTLEDDHCDRTDVLTFLTPPLLTDITLDGVIHLYLAVSSRAPDTAFVGRLSLVREAGNTYYLRQGAMTLSHREGNDHPSPYTPGEVVNIRMDMPPLLWTLRQGERLRLEISSSSFPSVAQHPNVYRNPWGEREPVPALQTLHLGPDHPSRLVFQVDRKETIPR